MMRWSCGMWFTRFWFHATFGQVWSTPGLIPSTQDPSIWSTWPTGESVWSVWLSWLRLWLWWLTTVRRKFISRSRKPPGLVFVCSTTTQCSLQFSTGVCCMSLMDLLPTPTCMFMDSRFQSDDIESVYVKYFRVCLCWLIRFYPIENGTLRRSGHVCLLLLSTVSSMLSTGQQEGLIQMVR